VKWSTQNCKGATYDYGDPVGAKIAQWEADGYVIVQASDKIEGNCYYGSVKACPSSKPLWDGTLDQYAQPICWPLSEPPASCPEGTTANANGGCQAVPATVAECREQALYYD